jgi:hypothetical protein
MPLIGYSVQRGPPVRIEAAMAAHVCRIAVILLFAGFARAADADWKFDQLVLTNGAVLRGLILDDNPAGVRFQNVRRAAGRPTVLFTTTLTRDEIARIDRLSAADREVLATRLRELEEAGPAEKQREERLELEPIAWPPPNPPPPMGEGPGGSGGWRYRSDYFVLESDATESVVRRAAARLELVYAAYARYLPPRVPARKPTAIELFQSRRGYEARLRAEGRQFVNVACYDPAADRILGYSDLERLGADLDQVRQQHQQTRADLDKQEKELTRLYRGSELARVISPLRATRKRLDVADGQNEAAFDHATRQLFAVLSHEAFHAYLGTVVYPPSEPGPPRWLNEGLAQVFETAVVEAGELRVGHADRDRLARAKEAVRKGELVPLAKLLRSTPKDFLAAHAADRAGTDAHYLTSWALAMHLAFERRLLSTTFLNRYFRALAGGADPEAAFADLVGQSLPTYEAAFHQYLLQLQSDGTAARPEK